MKKSILMGIAAICLTGATSFAVNSVPYTNTFEGYVAGSTLLGSVWAGDTNTSEAVVTNVTYSRTAGNPIEANSYTNVMAFSTGPITNEFDGTTSNLTFTAVDMMLAPVFAEPPPDDQMAVVSNSQCAIYVDTNGFINVFRGVLNSDLPSPPDSIEWLILTNMTQLTTGQWVRLTVVANYRSSDNCVLFKVAVNGQFINMPEGYTNPDLAGTYPTPKGGPWFAAASWSEYRLQQLVVYGTGMLDDLAVATSEISFNPQYATNGVLITWMQTSGLSTNSTNTTWDAVALDDEDGDGAPSWTEYYAGTHPTNPASKLVIVSLTYSNSAPILKWIGTTNARAPYAVQWSSNLMSVLNWEGATNNLPRSEGTNEVPLPPPVSNPGFLRVIVNTNAP